MFGKSRVHIDPNCRVSYGSFYIRGLYDVFGKRRVGFSSRFFSGLKHEAPKPDYEHYMALVVVGPGNVRKRVVIDFHDSTKINEAAYEWCDAYAKTNYNKESHPPGQYPKVVVTAPNSGYRIWGFNETRRHLYTNLLRCKLEPLSGRHRFRKDYMYQHDRRPIEKYESCAQLQDASSHGSPYVFFISTLWRHQNCIDVTNPYRKRFMDICRSLPIDFEGGFFGDDPTHPQYEAFKDLIIHRKYGLDSYIEKMTLSAFAFNTPAVHGCHGWKLSEYLAMGKAILSTPIMNELPAPLEHGRHVHFAQTDAEMREGVEKLIHDPAYREHLQEGACDYYRLHASPEAAIRVILESDPFLK
jgi:hypothetical protein